MNHLTCAGLSQITRTAPQDEICRRDNVRTSDAVGRAPDARSVYSVPRACLDRVDIEGPRTYGVSRRGGLPQTMTRPRAHLLSTYAAAVVLAVGTFGLLPAGCRPDYPSCETDKDCHEKEFCVARKCQQCRDSA